MTLVGAASAAQLPLDTAELAYYFIDAAFGSMDSRTIDQHGEIPGVTREYHAVVTTGKGKLPNVSMQVSRNMCHFSDILAHFHHKTCQQLA